MKKIMKTNIRNEEVLFSKKTKYYFHYIGSIVHNKLDIDEDTRNGILANVQN